MYGRRPYILLLEVNVLNNTKKITVSAMMVALASVFMLTSYFPYLTYAIPAIAGLFIMVAMIETNIKWATAAYFASAVIVFIMAEPEAKMLYVLFFGYYPLIKSLLERTKSRVLEYILKFTVFNAAVIFAYAVVAVLLNIPMDDMNDFGKYSVFALLIAANIIFPVYDIAVSRMAQFYIVRIHPSVNKIFKGK